jgi:hypothetical protein
MKPDQAANRAFLGQWVKDFLPNDKGTKMQKLYTASSQIFARAEIVAKLAGCTCGGLSEKKGVLFNIIAGYKTPEGTSVATYRHAYFPYESVIDEPSRVISWAREMHEHNKLQAKALGYTTS